MNKYFWTPLLNILGIILAVVLVYYIGRPWGSVSTPINSHAISEFQETAHAREILSPSTFYLKMDVYILSKNTVTNEETKHSCSQGIGTSFTVSEKGYFVTNKHVIDPKKAIDLCTEKTLSGENPPAWVKGKTRFDVEYSLTDSKDHSFPVSVFSIVPDMDMAVLKVDQTKIESTTSLPDKFVPVEFRSASPNIINGFVISGKGPYVLPDEPIITMGCPLYLPFTLTRGILGFNTFMSGRTNYIHMIIPINSGNSGGPVVSLLDFKVLGMTTLSKEDSNGGITQQSGMISSRSIESALKKISME